MPYIKPEYRKTLDPFITKLASNIPEERFAGTLNYIICRLAQEVFEHGLTFTRINQMIGTLECIKLELFRRIAVPYEEEKIAENGDLFP